jgi:predicted DNA-binding transcriptional regulator
MTELTPQQVDCILYNLRQWRRLLTYLEPRTSSSVVILPVSSSRGASGVEKVAVRRAVVSQVLDLAEEALRSLPSELRRVAHLKYREGMSLREIARELTKRKRKVARRKGLEAEPVSKSWVGTKLDAVRELCTQHIGSVTPEFWHEIWTLELRNRGQKA